MAVDDVGAVNRVRVEPSADIRGMASYCRQLFVGLVEQGFTEGQALVLLGHTIQGAVGRVDLD